MAIKRARKARSAIPTEFEPEMAKKFVSAEARERFEQEVKDRGDARAARIAIATNSNVHIVEKLVMPVLALGIVAISFLLVGILMFVNIPDSQENIVIYALGFLTSAATQVISFYFGSSQSSKDKSDLLASKK